MSDDRVQAADRAVAEAAARKPWVKPLVGHLAAGSAENIPGSAIFDGSLETTGS